MKIKTKKQLNLHQLIEWGFENDVTNTWHRASNVEEYISEVFFDATGLPRFSNTVNKNDTFTVEEEIEITGDTKFEHMIEIAEDDLHITWQNTKIDWEKDGESKEFHAYIDGEFKLIWRDGKLVE